MSVEQPADLSLKRFVAQPGEVAVVRPDSQSEIAAAIVEGLRLALDQPQAVYDANGDRIELHEDGRRAR